MNTKFRSGQFGALMDVYEKAIIEFQAVIAKISLDIYLKKFSEEALNSIQNIVMHVIKDGYVYANYYRKEFEKNIIEDIGIKYSSPEEAVKSLNEMFQYSFDTLKNKWDMSNA